MAINLLSAASAYNPGADLWILPSQKQSRWFNRVDWYLNFQLIKATRHHSPKIALELQDLTVECELPAVKIGNPPHRQMVYSPSLLPNKWVVVVEEGQDFHHWINEIHQIWKNLNEPSLRVFLPPDKTLGDFNKHWLQHSKNEDITIVLD